MIASCDLSPIAFGCSIQYERACGIGWAVSKSDNTSVAYHVRSAGVAQW
jgi:hypothetical protein